MSHSAQGLLRMQSVRHVLKFYESYFLSLHVMLKLISSLCVCFEVGKRKFVIIHGFASHLDVLKLMCKYVQKEFLIVAMCI